MKSGQFAPFPLTKEELENLFDQGFSMHKITKKYRVKWRNVKRMADTWKLNPPMHGNIIKGGVRFKNCSCCKEIKEVNHDNFNKCKKGGKFNLSVCRICNKEKTFRRHQSFKKKCVEYKGGKCIKCGYDKCYASLDFHHRDQAEKDFEISRVEWYKWEKMKHELDKCDCLCRNCHAELHFLESERRFIEGQGPTLLRSE
jgi:transposase